MAALSPLFVTASHNGLYKGNSTGNSLNPNGGAAITFGKTPIRLRLPNGTGKLSGSLLATKTKDPGPGPRNYKITGKVDKASSRQGGKKTTLKGKWTWDFKPLGTKSKAKGSFKITIKKIGRKYKISPPLDVALNGKAAGGDPKYRFTSRVVADK